MKIEYVDKGKTIYGVQPIRFRMVLQKYKDTFIISREIFNCGFTDGERDDVIFCPDLRSRYDTKISYMSIMTQRITDKEYLDIDIIKHDSHFENTLARDVDVEDLELTCSCGLINATRVYLDKGKATIRLYPFGYRGKFKLKIGWRWWPGLNEYELLLTD